MTLLEWDDARVPNASGALGAAFESVGDAFIENFADDGDIGACFAATIEGEIIVDIRGGWRERQRETPWTDETIACVYSTGKAVLAQLVVREVSSGRLDYAAPVAQYWPEFAAREKEAITLGEALSHQSGLVAFPAGTPPETYLDWDAACAIIANMAPLWTPGTANGYHPQTFGFIVGEVLRRVTGKTVGALLSELNSIFNTGVYCGLSQAEIPRTAQMQKPPRPPDLGDITEFKKLAFLSASSAPARVSREAWMSAEIPASNMHANALSLSRLLSPLANNGVGPNGAQLIEPSALESAFSERIRGDDLVLPFNLSWAAGLMRNINHHFGPNEKALGHAGFGGSCIVIDPEKRLTAAYVMNKMSPYLVGDPRALRLINAVYDAL